MLGMDLLRLLLFGMGASVLGLAFLLLIGIQAVIISFAATFLGGNSTAEALLFIGITLLLVLFSVFVSFLLLAPLAYLYVRWFIAVPALVDQPAGPRCALGISWQLTKNSAMRIFVIILLLWLLSLIVVALPLSLLQTAAFIVASSATEQVAISVLGTIASSALNILWQPLYIVTIVLLYFDQRVRQESYDLSLRLAALEAETAAYPATGEAMSGA